MSDHFFSRWSRRKQDAAKGVALDEVLAELDRREGTSGIAEKAARGQ